jgi:hypothetical protein
MPHSAIRTALFFALLTSSGLGAYAAEQGERYALLVGIGEYRSDSGLNNLKYPEADMLALRDTFKEIGFEDQNIRLMVKSARDERLNPRRENIVHELKLLLDNKRPEDVIIVVLSGHGLQPRDKDEAFFCPSDANLSKMETWLEMDTVFKMMKESQAGGKLLIADCCRDDPKLKNLRGAPLEVQSVTRPTTLKPPQTVSVLLSCANGQSAFEEDELKGGVFTHFLIKGLKGKAALNGEVEVKTLASYLQRSVYDYVSAKRGAQQNPTFKSDSDLPMVLARTRAAFLPGPVIDFERPKLIDGEVKNAAARRSLTTDPAIATLVEEAYNTWDVDKDVQKARALHQTIAAKLSLDPLMKSSPEYFLTQAWLERPDGNPKGNWARAAALAEQSANGFKAAGNQRWQGIMAQQMGVANMPTNNASGNWMTAATYFEEAFKLEVQAGDKREQADCLYALACCYDPDNNPTGNRTRAGTYYDQCAKLAAENARTYVLSGNKKLLAPSLLLSANCQQPRRNPTGSWEKALSAAADGAQVFKELGKFGDQADCVMIQAISTQPDFNPKGNYSAAAKLYVDAAQLFGMVSREADQASCLFQAGYCTRPDKNKESNWLLSATSFLAASVFYEKLNDKRSLGPSLLYYAYAMTQNNGGKLTPQMKATFERAAKLLRESNDKRATEAESWLK